jgi:microcin C transport system substrate-binding protein
MFFGQYERVGSYFENSELKATGLPSGLELEILESVRGGVPPEVFTHEYKNPVNLTPEDFRRHMSAAHKLFAQAGWKPKDGVLTNADGEPLTVEFLLVQPDFERLVQLYRQSLEKLGVKVSIRVVDSAQYRRRIDTFDFDIVVARFAQSLSPGNEQREFWGTEAAGKEGSRNIIGIKNPAIDKLVERIIFAKDRAELVAATRALDRVLLWNHYLVPQFYSPFERVALWDKFGRPDTLPTHASSLIQVLQAWWIDKDAAKRLELARQ